MSSQHPASGCSQIRSSVAEAALGIVSGPDRGAVMSHLAGCGECRATVDDLSRLADELLLLAPTEEPPLGFEAQVVLGLPQAIAGLRGEREGTVPGRPRPPLPPRVRSPRRTLAAILAATAVALLMAGAGAATGLALGRPDTRTATVVGQGSSGTARALVYGKQPAWIFVDLDVPGGGDQHLTVDVIVDGRARRLGELNVVDGYGALGGRLAVDGKVVEAVTIAERAGGIRHYVHFR